MHIWYSSVIFIFSNENEKKTFKWFEETFWGMIFFFNFENYLSMHPGFSMERFKVILHRAEVKFYLQGFKNDPLVVRLPGLLYQIVLVNQIMRANYPSKGNN